MLVALQTLTYFLCMPPTTRELCTLTGITSTNGVHQQLRALERRGLIKRNDAGARCWRLTCEGLREFDRLTPLVEVHQL